MFDKVLIANRGAIACRIIRTLRRMHVKSVAVYTEAEALSQHVTEADEAYCIGSGLAAESYLRTDKILEIAQQSDAQAIHPGYGFQRESRFCRAMRYSWHPFYRSYPAANARLWFKAHGTRLGAGKPGTAFAGKRFAGES